MAGEVGVAGLQDNSRAPTLDSPNVHPPSGSRSTRLVRYGGPSKVSEAGGLALIINIINYRHTMDFRQGAILDTIGLIGAFKRFDIPVYFVENQEAMLGLADIKFVIEDFKSKFVAGQHKFSFVAVMGHSGKEKGTLKDSYGQTFHIRPTIMEPFYTTKDFPKLHEKPKLFIMQCCRGDDVAPVVELVTDGPSRVVGVPGRKKLEGAIADILILWSTTEGFGSLRYPDSGSKFIQGVSEALQDYADSLIRNPESVKEFQEVMAKVQEESRHWVDEFVTTSGSGGGGGPPVKKMASQSIEIVNNLFRKFFLKLYGQSEYRP